MRFRTLMILLITMLALNGYVMAAPEIPSGNPSDFKVKTCLHSVSYAGVWRGQATLSVDEFLVKAKELGVRGCDADGETPACLAAGLR